MSGPARIGGVLYRSLLEVVGWRGNPGEWDAGDPSLSHGLDLGRFSLHASVHRGGLWVNLGTWMKL